jgi:hypothetical protein
LKKVQGEENLTDARLVVLPNDIEELPPKLRSKRSLMENEMREDKEMNSVYNKVLMMDDDDGFDKSTIKYSDELVDDDGFPDLVILFHFVINF